METVAEVVAQQAHEPTAPRAEVPMPGEVESVIAETQPEDDFSDIASLLAEGDTELELARAEDAATGVRSVVDPHATAPMPLLDLSEFDDLGDVDFTTNAPAEGGDFEFDAESTREMPAIELSRPGESEDVESETLGFGDLDDFADGDEGVDFTLDIETDEATAGEENSVDSDLAEAVELGEAAAAGSSVSDLQMLDLDWADTAAPAASDSQTEELQKEVPPPAIGSAFAWSLEDLDDSVEPVASKSGSEAHTPQEFGIETISASEYLAPDAEPDSDEPFNADVSLELIPLDEAVAPQSAGKSAAAHGGNESWLDTSNKVAISRVWVLGASIGGPEAVREFLGQMPKNFPALFLLAQHMGAEFMDIMAQQLVRSTALTVRTPSHGERVGHGDIVVVPTTHRLRVDREGVITLESLKASEQPNSPSIDQVVEDVADRFGKRAGVIIFSGMAEDAAEGCRHMAAKGGKVYVQDPETCVISSMVDGVIETGVVAFTGSPKALAERVLGDLKATGKN